MSFELGQRVRADGRVYRQTISNRKEWHKPAWKQKPIEGIYIGRRVYQNGIREWWGEDGGWVWLPKSYVSVGLIVRDARQNPIPVLYDDLEPA